MTTEVSPMIVIVGETASGKSALALRLAETCNGELICADSWTVYKGFDIGTAKPSKVEQAKVRHHLLDIADPTVGFSAAEFKRRATIAINEISNRGKLPILVGGTGLYIDSVLYDYQFLPPPSTGVRVGLSGLSLEDIQSRIASAGLDTSGIDLHNKRRLIRLIENNGVRPGRSQLRDNTLIIGMSVDRDHLRQRITERVDAMLLAGLEHEIASLLEQYDWQTEPMKGIGYREWQPYFEPQPGHSQDLEQTRQRIIAATMGLAKRQRTWFKRNSSIRWLKSLNTSNTALDHAVELVTTFIGR